MGKILVVDDHEPTCSVMARLIRKTGHDADYVTSGSAALASLKDDLPDVLILDFMMPDMDGLDVLRAIRRCQRTANLPVVMFSAVCDVAMQRYALAQGANEYWIKATMDFEKIAGRLEHLIPSQQPPPGAIAPQ